MKTERNIAKLTPRVMGGLIDLIIILFITSVMMFVWGLFVGASGSEKYLTAQESEALWTGRGALIGLLIDFIYTVGMQNSSTRATFGQKWMGLQIVSDAYQHVGLGKLIIRYVVSLFSSIILKIGYLFAIFTSKSQTLHDLAAGTIVVVKVDEKKFSSQVEITTKNNTDFLNQSLQKSSLKKIQIFR